MYTELTLAVPLGFFSKEYCCDFVNSWDFVAFAQRLVFFENHSQLERLAMLSSGLFKFFLFDLVHVFIGFGKRIADAI